MDIGLPELLIVLVIVILIFGVGRVGALGGELGNAIRQFRQGLKDDTAAAASAPKGATSDSATEGVEAFRQS